MGDWICIFCERPTKGKPCQCSDAIEDREKTATDFQKSVEKVTFVSAMCEVADALLAGGVPLAMVKLKEIGEKLPCITPKCVGVRGHFGPCSDGVNLIETKRWKSKVRKKGEP